MSIYRLGRQSDGLVFPKEKDNSMCLPGWCPDVSVCDEDFGKVPRDVIVREPTDVIDLSEIVYGLELSSGRIKDHGPFAGFVELGTGYSKGIIGFVSNGVFQKYAPRARMRLEGEYYTYDFPDKDIGLYPFRVVYAKNTGQSLYSVDARCKDPTKYLVTIMHTGKNDQQAMDRAEIRSAILSGSVGIHDRETSYEKNYDAFCGMIAPYGDAIIHDTPLPQKKAQ